MPFKRKVRKSEREPVKQEFDFLRGPDKAGPGAKPAITSKRRRPKYSK